MSLDASPIHSAKDFSTGAFRDEIRICLSSKSFDVFKSDVTASSACPRKYHQNH